MGYDYLADKNLKISRLLCGADFLEKIKVLQFASLSSVARVAENHAGIGPSSRYLEPVYLPMTVPHIPALRRGRPYESLDQSAILDYRNGTALATVSQVNAGIVRKDLAGIAQSRAALKKLSAAALIEICARAGEHFLNGTLPTRRQGGETNRRGNTSKHSRPPAVCRTSWCGATWRKFMTP